MINKLKSISGSRSHLNISLKNIWVNYADKKYLASVGADLSRTPPIYRPSGLFSSIQMY